MRENALAQTDRFRWLKKRLVEPEVNPPISASQPKVWADAGAMLAQEFRPHPSEAARLS